MSIGSSIRHWLIPHAGNNFRARLLHNSGIFAVIALVLVGNLFVKLLDSTELHILGFNSSISIDEVVRATNEKRLAAGLEPLNYNEKLADAARRKAANMIEENYWAHNSPSGKSPWVWFSQAGYKYTFAGENLAKDFGDTSRMMDAWMASPTHRDNIVSAKYKEIGLAVVPATLQGSETVLVVQLFGTSTGSGGSVPAETTKAASVATQAPTPAPTTTPQVAVIETKPAPVIEEPETTPAPAIMAAKPPEISQVIETQAIINTFNLKKYLSLATTALFILVLVLDLVIAESKTVSRRVGKNWAHIVFVNVILLAVTLVNAGSIL